MAPRAFITGLSGPAITADERARTITIVRARVPGSRAAKLSSRMSRSGRWRMARAQAGQFSQAFEQYKALVAGLGKPEQEEFAAQFVGQMYDLFVEHRGLVLTVWASESMSEEELAEIIRPAGTPLTKARRLRAVRRSIYGSTRSPPSAMRLWRSCNISTESRPAGRRSAFACV